MSMLPNPHFVRPPKSNRLVFVNDGVTKTKDSDRAEWDITMIIKRHTQLGTMPAPALREGQVFDASSLPNLQESLLQVRRARELFEALPSALRRELNNDPTRLEPWLQDSRNTELGIKLGLIKAPPKPALAPPPTGSAPGGQGAAEQVKPPAPIPKASSSEAV